MSKHSLELIESWLVTMNCRAVSKQIIKMKMHRQIRLFSQSIFIIILTGCSMISPWPRVDVVKSTLGIGDIQNYILKNRFSEEKIREIGSIFPEVVDVANVSLLENKYGMQCHSLGAGVACKYNGSIVNRFSANWKSHDYERIVELTVTWLDNKKTVVINTNETQLK